MKRTILQITASFLWLCAAFGQEREGPAERGRPVAGVQLSISLSTNVFTLGSITTVHATIKNASTNKEFIFHSGRLPHDFGVFLTDASGSKIDLSPKLKKQPINVDWGSLHIGIPPGASRGDEARVVLSEALKPGTYRLELTRELQTPGIEHTNAIISNPIVVKLIKQGDD